MNPTTLQGNPEREHTQRPLETNHTLGALGTRAQWNVPQTWWKNHTSSDLRYEVCFELATTSVLDAIWDALTTRFDVHTEGTNEYIVMGGAYLQRVDARKIQAVSAGEDALDSLEWAINDCLYDTIWKLNDTTTAHICALQERRIPLP